MMETAVKIVATVSFVELTSVSFLPRMVAEEVAEAPKKMMNHNRNLGIYCRGYPRNNNREKRPHHDVLKFDYVTNIPKVSFACKKKLYENFALSCHQSSVAIFLFGLLARLIFRRLLASSNLCLEACERASKSSPNDIVCRH